MTEPPPVQPTGRDLGVQSLRGLAVILLVAGHVIGDSSARGLQVSDDSGWRLFYLALEDFRLPLFTVLSGFVYGYRPVGALAGMRRLLSGKSRRLLVPMATVGTLFFAVQSVVPGTNAKPDPTQLWRIYLFGYEHLWFLQAIFLIFLLVGLLDALSALRSVGMWALAVGLSSSAFVLIRVPAEANVFSLNGALRLLPFFLLGYGMHRYVQVFDDRRLLFALFMLLLPVYSFRLAGLVAEEGLGGAPARALGIVVGMLGVTIFFQLRRYLQVPGLAWLGGFSFTVYLLHVFGSAGARLALGRAGVDDDTLTFAVALIAGVSLPVLFELWFGRFPAVSWSLLGQRPRRPRLARPRNGPRPHDGPQLAPNAPS